MALIDLSKPKVIVVEGLWGIGKTQLAKKIAKRIRGCYISEPSHLALKRQPKDRQEWYWRKFISRESLARKLRSQGKSVVLDRSRLSVVAYVAAMGENYSQYGKFMKRAKSFRGLRPDLILLVETRDRKIFSRLTNPRDKKHSQTPNLMKNEKFIHDYYRGLKTHMRVLRAKKVVRATSDRLLEKINA